MIVTKAEDLNLIQRYSYSSPDTNPIFQYHGFSIMIIITIIVIIIIICF